MEILKNKKEIKQTIDFVRLRLFPGQKPGSNIILKRLLCFSMLILLSSAGFATGGIAKLIIQARAQGSIFEPINDLLIANTTYSSPAIEREVVNPKYFDFNNLVALDLIQNRKQYISITLPGVSATGGDLIVDLVATPEADYDIRIKTNSGLQYSGRDVNLVHYWGIVRGYESQSLVFLSVSDDDVSMDISMEDAEYEIFKDELENIHVFYNQSEIEHVAQPYLCGDSGEGSFGGSPIENAVTKGAGFNKCVYVFIEVEHEVYLEAGSDYEKLLNRVLRVWNITAGMYRDSDITVRLRELRICVEPDDYHYNDIYDGNWGDKKQDYLTNAIAHIPTDVHVVHLATTFYLTSGIVGAQGKFKCAGSDMQLWPTGATFSGACNYNLCRKHNVRYMAHEIGHALGSGHTFDCQWNGDCTKLEPPGIYFNVIMDCNNSGGGVCVVGPEPEHKSRGTVMSYNEELKYWKGFGEQPGNRIRDFVNSQECLSSCDVSCNDLPEVINVWSFQDVHAGDYDNRHSEIATNAHNEIDAGGEAGYYSATQVFLKPGFKAHNGSYFHAAIKPCVDYWDDRSVSASNPNSDEEDRSITDGGFTVQAYPNPTTGKLVVELNGSSMYSISVVNVMGIPIFEQLNVSLSRIELDISDKAKGLYFIQVKSQNNKVERIKLILQ